MMIDEFLCVGLQLSDNMIVFVRLIFIYLVYRFLVELIRALGGTFK